MILNKEWKRKAYVVCVSSVAGKFWSGEEGEKKRT